MVAISAPDEEESYLLAILDAPDGLDLAEFVWYDAESPDGCYRAWDFQWCAPGDTVLYTDQGRRRLDQVVGPVRLLTEGQGERGRWVDAEVRSFGQAWVWSIDLERRGVRRTMQFTAHHRHFAGAGRADRRRYVEKRTFELEVGDCLQPMTSPQQDFTLDRQWVQAGVVFGDGTMVGERSLVRLYGAKRELAQYFDADATDCPHHDARVSAVQVRNLPGWFKTQLPEVTDKPSVLWGWLAGYFATDGSVLPDGTCVITSVDGPAMFHLRDVATALGIVVSGVGHRTRTTTMPNGYEHTSTELRVVLRASDLPLEFFLHPEHRQRVQDRGQVRSRAIDAWQVVGITPNVEQVEVFCAVVPETGSFVLDGDILTGNSWYTCEDMYQVDQGGRACGKTVSITMRAFALPFAYPGSKMLLTAPELNHLRPLTDAIEDRLLGSWLMRQMLPDTKGHGMTRQPHWIAKFNNQAQIVSRLPNKDGKGVKGQHVMFIELDEAQDYPLAGWIEVVETLNRFQPGAMWRCLAEGQLVLTRTGWVPIEKVQVGDEVWTHQQRWKPVLNVFDNGFQDCVSLSGQGHPGLVMTPNHKIWAADSRRTKQGRSLSQADWSQAAEVAARGGRWASPVGVTDVASVPAMVRAPRSRHAGVLDTTDPAWLWLYGLYLAEGYACSFATKDGRTSRRVHWCVNDGEVDEVESRLRALGVATHRYAQGHSVKVVVNGQPIHDWLREQAGELAAHKRLAPWVFGLNRVQRQAIFDGMVYGDGSWSELRQRWEYGTNSRELAFGLKLLAQSLGLVANVALKPAKVSVIEGRTVQSQEHYVVQMTKVRPRGQTLVSDGHAWGLLRPQDVKQVGQRHVYDLEVADDHSYVVEGIVVSNCHGVPKGVRDKFFEMTEGAGDEDRKWTVHRPMAPNRPTWSAEERNEKVKEYGGSRQNIDYKRNIYGEHGDASNSVFVLARLMDCVDTDEGSVYNQDIYTHVQLEFERLPQGPSITDEVRQQSLLSMIDIPGSHLHGYSQIVDRREVGSPKGYSAYWGGADIGVTNHPSEFLVFGQRMGTDVIELLLRINLQRINTDDQKYVIEHIFKFYGPKLKVFALDKTGVGFPIWDQLSRYPEIGNRIRGYNFSEKVPVAFLDRPLERGEKMEDLAIWRNVVEATTDFLRNDYVDAKKIRLPYDREILLEFQGQTYCQGVDTEILTDRGWLTYDQVEPGDRTLGLAMDGTSAWTDISAVNVFPAVPREMVHMEGAHLSSVSTMDHRWYARRLGKNAPIEMITSGDLVPDTRPAMRGSRHSGGRLAGEGKETQNRWRIPITATRTDLPTVAKYDDDFVELVAWFWTEGHWARGKYLCFGQSLTANATHVARIEALLERMLGEGARDVGIGQGRHGRGWSVTTGSCNQYRVLNADVRRAVADVVSRSTVSNDNKVVSAEFLASLTESQLKLFIDVSLLADGSEFTRSRPGRADFRVRTFIQKGKARTSCFEMACALVGIATRTTKRVGADDIYVVTLSSERYTSTTSAKRELVIESVEVWCPTTSTGTWLARRNGRVFFTGNTVIKDTGNPYGQRRLFGGGSFHCVDETTEILTANGWRTYDAVKEGESVLTLDMTTGSSRWSDVEEMSIFPGPPTMVRSVTNAHDSLTTSNHRWPVRAYDAKTRSHGPLKWKTTETLSVNDSVPLAVPYADAPTVPSYSDTFVELMAWFWTEGNMTKSNTVITQSDQSQDNVEEIRRALTEEFGPHGYMPNGMWHEYWSGHTCYFILNMAAGSVLRSMSPDRIPRPEFLLALTNEQLDLFIRTSEKGDGNHYPGSTRRSFQHMRDENQNRMLEMACALAGIATTTWTYENAASRSGTSTTTALVEKKFVRPGKSLVTESYDGIVWCPRTRDGNWLARRNGHVYWTGNTLDAAKMVMAGRVLPPILSQLENMAPRGPVLDVFVGA